MKVLPLALLCCLSVSAYAESVIPTDQAEREKVERVQTGRYSFVQNIPPVDQLNPLKVVIRTRVPQSINSVGQTVEFLLARSGYVLADASVLSEEAKVLLDLPLPAIHRTIGPMTLDRALNTLSGEAFELIVDPVHRKVAFELSEKLGGKS
jgi:type IV pili sensor histidine kinase/response regulator